MPFSSKAVANYFLEVANGEDISPMKMQKLVYYAHGWHLAVTGRPLINEQIEAWQYGPVVPSLFRSLKHFGHEPISSPIIVTEIIKHGDVLDWRLKEKVPKLSGDVKDVDLAKRVIEKVWEEYGVYTATKLSNMTHEPDGPWDRVIRGYGGEIPKGTDIPTEYIREHFTESLNRNLR